MWCLDTGTCRDMKRVPAFLALRWDDAPTGSEEEVLHCVERPSCWRKMTMVSIRCMADGISQTRDCGRWRKKRRKASPFFCTARTETRDFQEQWISGLHMS